jgi:hypothetical protein
VTARSIRSYELIGLAERLVPADAGKGRPRTVDLGRAVFTAYYALFHELISQATNELTGTDPVPQRSQVARWFAHSEIKTLAKAATDARTGGANPALSYALGVKSRDLVRVADAFASLLDARHDADYNHEYDIKRGDALSFKATARDAIDTVRRMQGEGDPSFRRFLRLMVVRSK